MSRPALTPRLGDLEPRDVVRAAFELLDKHWQNVAALLRDGKAPPVDGWDAMDGYFGRDLYALTVYAQHGEWRRDLPDHAKDPLAALLVVGECLYAQPGRPGALTVAQLEAGVDGAALDAVGLVLVGAYARTKLETRGSALTARELGVLAGVDPQHVRLLARRDAISLEGGGCPRAEARRWLAARGVPGVP